MKIEDIDTAAKIIRKCESLEFLYKALTNITTAIERKHGSLKISSIGASSPRDTEINLAEMDKATRRILAMALTMEAERIKKQIEGKQLP